MNLLDPSLWWIPTLLLAGAFLAFIAVKWAYKITIGGKKQALEGTWIFIPKQGKKD